MAKQDLLVVIAGDNTDLLKKLRATKRDISSLGKDLKSIGTGLTSALTLPLVAAGAAVVGFSADFDSAMSEVQAKTGASADEFERLRNIAKELGATTRFSATEAANAMTFLAQAGFSASEIMASLEDILALAAAGNLDLARAADIASNVLSGFGLAADQAGRAADVMAAAASSSNTSVEQLGQALSFVAPVAKDIGLSLEETTAIIGKLSDAGIQATRAGTGLRAAMLRLLNPTKEVQATFDKLGVSVRDSQGELRPFLDIMKDLNRVGADATDMAKIFGQETVSAASVIRDAAGGDIQAFSEDLKDSTGAARAMAAVMDDNLKGAFRALKSALEGLAIAVGDSGLSDDIRSIVESLTAFVRKVSEADPQLLRFGTVLAGVAAVVGPLLLGLGGLAGSVVKILSVSGPMLTALQAVGAALSGWVGVAAAAAGAVGFLGLKMFEATKPKRDFDAAMSRLEPIERFKGDLKALGVEIVKQANETWPEYAARMEEAVKKFKLVETEQLAEKLKNLGLEVERGGQGIKEYSVRLDQLNNSAEVKEIEALQAKLAKIGAEVIRGNMSWEQFAAEVRKTANTFSVFIDQAEGAEESTDQIAAAFDLLKGAAKSAGSTTSAAIETLRQALDDGKITQQQFNQAMEDFRASSKKTSESTKELKKSVEELVAAGELGVFTGEDLARVWNRAASNAEQARKAWAEVVKQVGISVPTLADFKKAADAAVQAAGAMRDKLSTVAAVFPPINFEMSENVRKTFELEATYKKFGLTSQAVADTNLEALRQKLEFARAEFEAGRLSLEQLNGVQEEYNEALGTTNSEMDVLKALGEEITGIIANLGSAITDAILGAGSLGEAFVSAAKQIAGAILDTIIQGALNLMKESILENDEAAKALIKSFKKFIGLFTGNGGVSVPGGGGGGGGGGLGGGGGTGGPAGGLGNFTNVLSALDSLVNIVTNLINLFTFRRMEKDLGRIEVTTRGLLNEALNLRADQWQQHEEVLAKWDMAIQTLFDMKDLVQRLVDGSPTAAPAPGGSGSSDLLLAAVNRVGDILNAWRLEFANFTVVFARPQLDHIVEQTSLLAAILMNTSRIADAVAVITAIPATSQAAGTFNLTINAATNDPRAIAESVRREAERMGFGRSGSTAFST